MLKSSLRMYVGVQPILKRANVFTEQLQWSWEHWWSDKLFLYISEMRIFWLCSVFYMTAFVHSNFKKWYIYSMILSHFV